MLKKIIRKIKHLKALSSSSNYVSYLKSKGMLIGENTHFFSPKTTTVDTQCAYMITIGKNCKITQGVTILAHDYSYSVCRSLYHDIPKKAAETIIGDNVFIGINSIILMGSKIGNNVVIGAGAVVSGEIPDNEVWGGNPARFICTLEDYHKKCYDNFEGSAILTVKKYRERFLKNPSIQEMQYFSMLFLNNDKNAFNEYEKMKFSGDNKKEVLEDCLKYKSKYKNYEDFLNKIN